QPRVLGAGGGRVLDVVARRAAAGADGSTMGRDARTRRPLARGGGDRLRPCLAPGAHRALRGPSARGPRAARGVARPPPYVARARLAGPPRSLARARRVPRGP